MGDCGLVENGSSSSVHSVAVSTPSILETFHDEEERDEEIDDEVLVREIPLCFFFLLFSFFFFFPSLVDVWLYLCGCVFVCLWLSVFPNQMYVFSYAYAGLVVLVEGEVLNSLSIYICSL